MPVTLLVQIICAVIAQIVPLAKLIDQLRHEQRDATPEEVANLKATSPILHAALTQQQQ
jgi:hypothetical protein